MSALTRKADDQGGQGNAKKPRRVPGPLDTALERVETEDEKGRQAMVDFLQDPSRSHNELRVVSEWLRDYWTNRMANQLKRLTESSFPTGLCIPIRFVRGESDLVGWAIRVLGVKNFSVHIVTDRSRRWNASSYFSDVPIEDIRSFDAQPVPFPIQRANRFASDDGQSFTPGQIVWFRALCILTQGVYKDGMLQKPITGVLLSRLGFVESFDTYWVQVQPCAGVDKAYWGLQQAPTKHVSHVARDDFLSRVNGCVLTCMNASLRSLIVDYLFDPRDAEPLETRDWL
jgi:hypothetical protein